MFFTEGNAIKARLKRRPHKNGKKWKIMKNIFKPYQIDKANVIYVELDGIKINGRIFYKKDYPCLITSKQINEL